MMPGAGITVDVESAKQQEESDCPKTYQQTNLISPGAFQGEHFAEGVTGGHHDEPEATDYQKARDVGMFAGVEEDAGSGEEDEGGGAEMRNPSGEEDSGSGAAGGQAGVDADVVDGHDDHDGATDNVDGSDTGDGGRSCYGGSGLKSGAHGTLRSLVRRFSVGIWKHSFDGEGMKRFEETSGGFKPFFFDTSHAALEGPLFHAPWREQGLRFDCVDVGPPNCALCAQRRTKGSEATWSRKVKIPTSPKSREKWGTLGVRFKVERVGVECWCACLGRRG